MTAPEVQDAGYPDAVGEGLDDPALVIVQDAPITYQGSTGRGGDQSVEGGHELGVGMKLVMVSFLTICPCSFF